MTISTNGCSLSGRATEKEENTMKFCPTCGTQTPDNAAFCPNCGTSLNGTASPAAAPAPVPYVDPYDHTEDFDPKDISDNKVLCMVVYLMGIFGVVIALLGSHDSPYTAFHVRQALKFTVVGTLTGILGLLLCWTIIAPIAAGIFAAVLFVIKVICFFQICNGKATEPYIIRSLGFLK